MLLAAWSATVLTLPSAYHVTSHRTFQMGSVSVKKGRYFLRKMCARPAKLKAVINAYLQIQEPANNAMRVQSYQRENALVRMQGTS